MRQQWHRPLKTLRVGRFLSVPERYVDKHTHVNGKKNILVRTGQNGSKCYSILVKTGQKGKTQILALRVYNMPTVSTISRPRLLVVHSVYRPQTALPLYAGKRC